MNFMRIVSYLKGFNLKMKVDDDLSFKHDINVSYLYRSGVSICMMAFALCMHMGCGYQFQNRQIQTHEKDQNLIIDVEDQQGQSEESHGMIKSIFRQLFKSMVKPQSNIDQVQIILLSNSRDEIESYDQFGRLNLTQSKIRLKIKILRRNVLWESSIQETIFSNRYHHPLGLHLSESVTQNEWYLCLKNAIQEYVESLNQEIKSRD
jgi:hypothetical protein